MPARNSFFAPAALVMNAIHATAQTAAISSKAAPSSSAPRTDGDGTGLGTDNGMGSTSAASDSPQLQRPPVCAEQVSMWMESSIGGHLVTAGVLCAQVGPVDVGSDVLAPNCASGLAVECDAQALTDTLASADRFAQIALACIARCSVGASVRLAQAVEVLEEFVHNALLLFSNASATPFGNLPLSN